MTSELNPVDVLVTFNPRLHACVVQWRSDLSHSVSPCPGARWLANGSWSIPGLEAWTLLQYFRDQFPDLRVSFDKASADIILARLQREQVTTALALAEDGDVPDVLSVKMKPFQRAGVAFGLHSKPRKLFAMPTGTGKTAMACAYARVRQSRTLWVTKSGLVSNLTREIAKLTNQSAIELLGTSPEGTMLQHLVNGDTQHHIISYDSLTRNIGDDGYNLWSIALANLGRFDLLVVDEAHNMKNRASNRWKVIKKLESIPAVLFLTATPLVNNGADYFALLNILDSEVWQSETEFLRTYFTKSGKQVLAPKRLQHDLLPYMFRRTREQVMPDLPPKIRTQHTIRLTDEWQQKYDLVLDGIYMDTKGVITEVPSSILAQINRFRQVVSQAKVEHTVEHARTLEEAGEKVIVFTAWRETADAISDELFCPVIHGGISKEKRTENELKFQNDPTCRFLVGTFDTLGEGLNLTAATAILFNDYEWTPKDHDQAEGRAWGRLNDMHGCLIYYVAVQNSIDSFMMGTLQRKQEMIDAGVNGQKVFATAHASMLTEFVSYLKGSR